MPIKVLPFNNPKTLLQRTSDPGKVAMCGMASAVFVPGHSLYIGTVGETVQWSQPSDAASFTPDPTDLERIAAMTQHIHALIAQNKELEVRLCDLSKRCRALEKGPSDFASRSEAGLVERTFPANALKHSR